jgi:hypothetical protein
MPLNKPILERLKAMADSKPRRRRSPFPPVEAMEVRLLLSATALDVGNSPLACVDLPQTDGVPGQDLPDVNNDAATFGEGSDSGVPIDTASGDEFPKLVSQDGVVLDVGDDGTAGDGQIPEDTQNWDPSWAYRTLTPAAGEGDDVMIVDPSVGWEDGLGCGIAPDGFVPGEVPLTDADGDGVPDEVAVEVPHPDSPDGPVVCYFGMLSPDNQPETVDANGETVDPNGTDTDGNPVEGEIGPIRFFEPQFFGPQFGDDGQGGGDVSDEFVLYAYDPLPIEWNGELVERAETGGGEVVSFGDDVADASNGGDESPNVIFYSFNTGTGAVSLNDDGAMAVIAGNVDPGMLPVASNTVEADVRSLWLLFADPNQTASNGTQAGPSDESPGGASDGTSANSTAAGGESLADQSTPESGMDLASTTSPRNGIAASAVDEVFSRLDIHL